MTLALGQEIVVADVLGAIAGATNVVNSGHFYSDSGANIVRYGDRLFAGAATDNQGAADRSKTADWLSLAMAAQGTGAWPVWGATGASLSRFGTIGLLGGSRTSDAAAQHATLGYTPSSIGVASWAIDDDTAAPRTTTAYAYYGEVWRMAGVSYQPAFALELEGVAFGAPGIGLANPYTPNVGGGISVVQLGSGGGQPAAAVADIASYITMVPNPARAQAGLVVAANAITGTSGTASDTGYGAAIMLGRNQAIEWHTPETASGVTGGSVGMFLRSTVKAAANATRWEAQDSGLVISNTSGQQLFAVSTAANATNSLFIQAGTGAGAAGLYVAEGSGGSPNLLLQPASGGELQITSPIGNAGGAIPATAAGGFLHININGTDYRIPLLTPAQAGS